MPLKTSDLKPGDFRLQVGRDKLHVSGVIEGLHRLGPQEISNIIAAAMDKLQEAIAAAEGRAEEHPAPAPMPNLPDTPAEE